MPNTLHYVVTVEDSIVYGRHTLSASSSPRIAMGIVHSFILGYRITNALHEDFHTMLRRMMVMWCSHYAYHPLRGQPDNHIPDLSKPAGLLDVIAIGNVLECAQVLDRRTYGTANLPRQEQSEMAIARRRYRQLAVIFAQTYETTVGGRKIHPLLIFRRCLVEFAAAVVVYKREQPRQWPSCKAEEVEQKTMSLFELNYPELIPSLRRLIQQGFGSFVWSGPTIGISPKMEPLLTQQAARERDHEPPLFDFLDQAIYASAEEDSTVDDAVAEDGRVTAVPSPRERDVRTHGSGAASGPIKRCRRTGPSSSNFCNTQSNCYPCSCRGWPCREEGPASLIIDGRVLASAFQSSAPACRIAAML